MPPEDPLSMVGHSPQDCVPPKLSQKRQNEGQEIILDERYMHLSEKPQEEGVKGALLHSLHMGGGVGILENYTRIIP